MTFFSRTDKRVVYQYTIKKKKRFSKPNVQQGFIKEKPWQKKTVAL